MVQYFDKGGDLPSFMLGPAALASGAASDTTTTLNAAQVFGTSGGGVAFRFVCSRASAIAKIHVFVNSITGTAGNLAVQGEIRNARITGTNFQNWPNTTVRQTAVTGTWATKGAKHWVQFDFTVGSTGYPYTPVVGEVLWLNIFNTAAAPATDYPSIITTTGYQVAFSQSGAGILQVTTTNGFTTAGTASGGIVAIVEYADGTIDGIPYTRVLSTFYTSNTRERGIVIDGLDSPIWVSGIRCSSTAASVFSGAKIYGSGSASGTQASGGSTLASISLTADQSMTGVFYFTTPVLLPANTKMRAVLTFGSSSQLPTIFNIEASTDFADCSLCGYGGNTLGYSTVDDGAGSWTDDKSAWGGLTLLVNQIPAIVKNRGIYTGSKL